MSMFHELMMRKKEETLYPVIKGTLTENDGVFSGFSDGKNYLLMQQSFTPQDKSWKIRATFTTGSDRENAKVLFVGNTGTGNYGGFIFGTYSRHFWFNIGSTGTSWNIQATGQSTNVIEINTQYTVEFGFTGTEYFIDNIENGVATRVFTVSSSTPIYQNGSFTIGLRLNDSNNWIGSIDLNKSYIKIGSTKYNLQAVVGYTVVGSPTIVDGVVSGFSSSDYLQTSQSFDVSNTNWEFVIKASKASTGNARLFCINNGNGAMHTIFGLTSFSCTILTTTLTISQNFTADNFYFFKIKRNGNMLSLSWSSDGIIYQDEQSAELTSWGNSGNVYYGRVSNLSSAGFGGSIDIANSLIKINNKLVFNGQQS